MNIYDDIAKSLNVEPGSIYAIVSVESNNQFTRSDGTIPILFERHWVYKLIKKSKGYLYARKMYKLYPYLCSPKRGGYGKFSEQYIKLNKASELLGEEIAHQATSFGAFQIMGFNYKVCGYDSAKEMRDAYESIPLEQVKGFMNFISDYRKGKILVALRDKNWQKVARLYNGSAYKENRYDSRLATAYLSYKEQHQQINEASR